MAYVWDRTTLLDIQAYCTQLDCARLMFVKNAEQYKIFYAVTLGPMVQTRLFDGKGVDYRYRTGTKRARVS